MDSQAEEIIKDFNMYNIGWITALPHELAAGLAMRDEKHGRPRYFKTSPNDSNTYNWGMIGNHHVVLACLPTAGIGAAADVARAMTMSLPHLRCVLMVGIGGGIPSKKNNKIRLGDIVVSVPAKTSGGIVEYDLRARHKDGSFVRKGHLNQPPNLFIKGIHNLISTNMQQESRVPQIIREVLEKTPKMASTFMHPGRSQNRLFPATTPHTASELPGCASCDSEGEVLEPERRSTDPVIHHGIIASGNSVIKDGVERDKIVKDLDLGEDPLCFEMEAAGLMNNTPCVVIRGICDYSDAHKNDVWQNYAALTAVAYTKELLEHIVTIELEQSSEVQHLMRDDNYDRILRWLSQDDQESEHRSHLNRWLEGTCRWFWDSPEFSAWMHGDVKTLYCPGLRGSGKTTLAAATIRRLRSHGLNVAFYYYRESQRAKQSPEPFVRAIARQVAHYMQPIPTSIKNLYERDTGIEHRKKKAKSKEQRGRTPTEDILPMEATFNDFCKLLGELISNAGPLYVVIDALDECIHHIHETIYELKELQSFRDVRLLVTSRPRDRIAQHFPENSNSRLSISAKTHNLEYYLHKQRLRFPLFEGRQDLRKVVISVITQKAEGRFLPAHLYVRNLEKLSCEEDVLRFRKSANVTSDPTSGSESDSTSDTTSGPTDLLTEVYRDSLEEIERLAESDRVRAQHVTTWVLFAQKPLGSEGLRHAVAITESDAGVGYKARLVSIEELVGLCAGLVTWDRQNDFVEIVHLSAREFLQNSQRDWIERGPMRVARACLKYLRRLKRPGLRDTYQDVSDNLLDYCVNHACSQLSNTT